MNVLSLILIEQMKLAAMPNVHGDCHRSTMEMADYWLLEKQQIHKLFKVLVPRFENYTVAFTRVLKAPRPYPGHYRARAVLELR
ncbi:unnamed protein product, partial [Timema podura]|nr:unnamed protein product [Timema podura]